MEIKLQKVYSVKSHFPFGHIILFEDIILVWILNKTLADKICAMLNGAYNLGFMSANLE